MDILFLLVPVSVALALAVMGLLAWAVGSGQFEDMESEGQRIFEAPDAAVTSVATAQMPTDADIRDTAPVVTCRPGSGR